MQPNLDAYLDKLPSIMHINPGLDAIKRSIQHLGLDHWDCPVITITGTNGKGSCVRALESIYNQAGYQVASFTSPHIHRFNERFCWNQEPLSDVALCEGFEAVAEAKLLDALSYFEHTLLVGLWAFKQRKPDVLILEVGLGGRLDATNALDTDCAVITTVDLDHQAWLGDTREQIGLEKAGIMRTAKPVVLGEGIPASVLKHAEQLGAHRHGLDVDAHYKGLIAQSDLHPNSLRCAVTVVEAMQARLPVTQEELEQGVKAATLLGRWVIHEGPPLVLMDVAHNVQACIYLSQKMQAQFPDKRWLIVAGFLEDKQILASLKAFAALAAGYLLSPLTTPRSASVDELTEIATGLDNAVLCKSISDAVHKAKGIAVQQDLGVAVIGSFYTLAEVL